MCIHCDARGRHESRRAHSASWRSIYTRSELSFSKRSFYFSARKHLKGSPVVASVATAKWKDADEAERAGRDVLWTPSTRQTSRPGVRLHKLRFEQLWLSSTTSSESSRIHVLSTHRRPSRAKRAASEKNPCWRRSTWTRANLRPPPAVIPLCMNVMDGVPDKNSSLSIISYEKASQVFEEKELDKHRPLAQWGVVRLVVVVRGVESTTGSAWMMGVQVRTGTRIHWDAHQTFFCTKLRGRGGVQANSSRIRI